jgi:8-oxo-dGTP pyrophosphatase MutT (NUDIX family)
MSKRIKKWETISSRVILKHKFLKVTEDEVLLPDGKTSTYVRLAPSETHSVLVIAINSKNQILIQREYSYPPDKIMWQFPGGSMHKGESIKSAAQRELAEESGYGARKLNVIGSYYVHNRSSDEKQYVVLCKDLYRHKLAQDEDEFIESIWMSKKELSSLIAEGKIDNINLLAGLSLWLNRKRE